MMPMGDANPAESPANEHSKSLADFVPDATKTAELQPLVMDALRTVYDPEIPVNITELGLIYDVMVDAQSRVGVRMTDRPGMSGSAVAARRGASEGGGRARRQRGARRGRLGSALDQGADVGRREAAARPVLTAGRRAYQPRRQPPRADGASAIDCPPGHGAHSHSRSSCVGDRAAPVRPARVRALEQRSHRPGADDVNLEHDAQRPHGVRALAPSAADSARRMRRSDAGETLSSAASAAVAPVVAVAAVSA